MTSFYYGFYGTVAIHDDATIVFTTGGRAYGLAWASAQGFSDKNLTVQMSQPTTVSRRNDSTGWLYIRDSEVMRQGMPGEMRYTFWQQTHQKDYVQVVSMNGSVGQVYSRCARTTLRCDFTDAHQVNLHTDSPPPRCDANGVPLSGEFGYLAWTSDFLGANNVGGGVTWIGKWPDGFGIRVEAVKASEGQAVPAPVYVEAEVETHDLDQAFFTATVNKTIYWTPELIEIPFGYYPGSANPIMQMISGQAPNWGTPGHAKVKLLSDFITDPKFGFVKK
jgi:hypothetical protein